MDKPLEYADDLDDDEARQALCTSNARGPAARRQK